MTNKRLTNNTVVLVSTGDEAKIFRNMKSSGVQLEHQHALTPQDLDDDGPAGVRPPESSPRETDEATFSKQLSEYLYKRVHAGEIKTLVVIADPDTLGELRPILHQEVSDIVVLEIPKTMIHASVEDIERSIEAAL